MSQWEESKRLNGRIEALKKKLHGKGEEVVEVQREADKHRLHADKLQVWGVGRGVGKCGRKCGMWKAWAQGELTGKETRQASAPCVTSLLNMPLTCQSPA